MSKSNVKRHVAENAFRLAGRKQWWLPAVYSERDPLLREALIDELGSPTQLGYMSEETGWLVYPDEYGCEDESGDE